MRLDPVQVEVFKNHFSAIANEMGYIIWRTAFTAYVKETWDFAQGLATPDGELFAFSKDIGGAPFLGIPLRELLNSIDFDDGDIVICNDPYSTYGTCTHLPDLHLLKPLFHQGQLVCFMWDFIHAADVGGITPGSAPPSTRDIHQEGVSIPPTKLFKKGHVDREIRSILLSNTRVPHDIWGDIKALVAALNSAERRMRALIERYGVETVTVAMEDVLEYAETRSRAILAEIPDGEYSFVDYVEGYPGDGMPFRIELALSVQGSDVFMDFSGTDIQMSSSYNIPTDGKNHHFLTFGLVAYIRSRDPACPLNSGMVRAVEVYVPKGTLLNPEPGASCSVRFVTAERVLDVVMGALAKAGAPMIPAAGGGCVAPVLFSVLDPRSGRYKMGILQMLLGGMGGRDGLDGVDGVDFGNGFFRNGPNEVAEAELPILVRRYEWDDRGAPAGEARGGLGVIYEFEAQLPNSVMTARCMERERFRPWGRGGDAGTLIASTLNPGTNHAQELGKIDVLYLGPGDAVQIRMPAGGGFGDPFQRDPRAVCMDVKDGYVTTSQAREQFGVALEDGAVDEDQTAALRSVKDREPATPFNFGPERTHYEEIFAQPLQRLSVDILLSSPSALRGYMRDWLWREVVKPALESNRPLTESAVVEPLQQKVNDLQHHVETRG